MDAISNLWFDSREQFFSETYKMRAFSKSELLLSRTSSLLSFLIFAICWRASASLSGMSILESLLSANASVLRIIRRH
jgi:hypothetical protein